MENLKNFIDHTLLKPDAIEDQFINLCNEANQYEFFSVCLPSTYIKLAKSILKKSKVCTVVGFPLGYNLNKEAETEDSLRVGVDEIDMVINISHFKSGKLNLVKSDIKALKSICGNKILKVIVETAYLNSNEVELITNIVGESGADFIKTSTGFAPSGAKIDDVKLMKKIIDKSFPNLKIKASGGIRSKEDALNFINVGASRLGTSSGIKICNG